MFGVSTSASAFAVAHDRAPGSSRCLRPRPARYTRRGPSRDCGCDCPQKSEIELVNDDRSEQKRLAVGLVIIGDCEQGGERIARMPAAAAGRIVEIEIADHYAVGERGELGRRALERAEHARRLFAARLAGHGAGDVARLRVVASDGAREAVDQAALAFVYRFRRQVGVRELMSETVSFCSVASTATAFTRESAAARLRSMPRRCSIVSAIVTDPIRCANCLLFRLTK